MSIFGKLLKTTFDLATLPVDLAKDVVTLGGVTTERGYTYTGNKLRRLHDDVEEVRDELDSL